MTADHVAARAAAPGSPVLFIVDADRRPVASPKSALVRRFGPDYRVLVAGTPEDALTDVAASGRPTAARWRWWQPTCACPAWTALSSSNGRTRYTRS